MKEYPTYVCEKCGFESTDKEKVLLCEAKHIGLSTVDEWFQWNSLNEWAKFYARSLFINATDDGFREKKDIAYKELLSFEKEHHMTLDKKEEWYLYD